MKKIVMKTTLIILGAALLFVLVSAGCAAVRGGYASAPCQVVRAEGDFQVRDYPALTLVATPMQDDNHSFMRLFHYIDRQNSAQQKIAMTTPVFMTKGTNASMAFVLPASLPLTQAPQPADGNVRLQEQPAGRFAVLRFSGGMSREHETNALAQLQVWLVKQSLTPVGEPIYGYFDPPWTPPFLRRNEVMLRLLP